MKWYEIDKKRLVLEYLKMKEKYPQLELKIIENQLQWEGEINSCGNISLVGIIRVEYKDSFPFIPPRVYFIKPQIPAHLWGHKWHRWEDGRICFVNPDKWSMNYYAVDIVDKVVQWYTNFILYITKQIEKMPDVGIASEIGGNS